MKAKKLFILFILGAFIGFLYEEGYYLITSGKLLYRGSTYGPWLPIYGIGTIFIYLLLYKYKKHPSIIFFGSIVLTGIIEYIGGYICEHIIHMVYWNYSGKFLNINNYVCLESVLLFGIISLMAVYVVIPLFEKYTNKMKEKTINKVYYVLLTLFIVDEIINIIYPNTLGLYM